MKKRVLDTLELQLLAAVSPDVGAGGKCDCEPPCGSWEVHLGPLQEQVL